MSNLINILIPKTDSEITKDLVTTFDNDYRRIQMTQAWYAINDIKKLVAEGKTIIASDVEGKEIRKIVKILKMSKLYLEYRYSLTHVKIAVDSQTSIFPILSMTFERTDNDK